MKWMRPSGTILETNDFPGTIEDCEKKGWKRVDDDKPKKRGRPKKDDKVK